MSGHVDIEINRQNLSDTSEFYNSVKDTDWKINHHPYIALRDGRINRTGDST